jgi:hypothetical protein
LRCTQSMKPQTQEFFKREAYHRERGAQELLLMLLLLKKRPFWDETEEEKKKRGRDKVVTQAREGCCGLTNTQRTREEKSLLCNTFFGIQTKSCVPARALHAPREAERK